MMSHNSRHLGHRGAPSLITSESTLSSLHRHQFAASRVQTSNDRRRSVTTNSLKGVLFDLDGVMYESGTKKVIPGAVETVQYFRDRQIPWLFVTNTSTKNREGLAERLRDIGIHCNAEDIVSPAKLAADWLRTNGSGPAALFVAPDLTPEFEGIPLLPPTAQSGAGAVVIGDMGLDWNYSELNRAFRLVMEGQARTEAAVEVRSLQNGRLRRVDGDTCGNGQWKDPSLALQQPPQQQHRTQSGPVGSLSLISLGKARYYKDSDGYSIDVGPFTAAIEFAADVKALVLGKPDPLIFRLAAQSLGLKPEEVVMIGDDVHGDVGGAQSAGLRGVLVRTGKFRERDLHVGVRPDGVLQSVADLPSWWEDQRQRNLQKQQEQQREQQQQHQQNQQNHIQQQQQSSCLGPNSRPSAVAMAGA